MPHVKIRPFSARDTHPGKNLSNDLCQAVRAGDQVFLRGQVGSTLEGESVGIGDPAAQTEQAMRNIKQLLEEAGSSLQHIVKMTVYLTDIRYRQAVYEVLGERMRGIHYCSVGLVVSALARPEWLVEIDAHAVIPQDEMS